MFTRPSTDLGLISERLDATGVLVRPDNAGTVALLIEHISKIKDMRPVMHNLRKGLVSGPASGSRSSNSAWISIRDLVYYSIRIADAMSEINEAKKLSVYGKILGTFERRQLAAIGKLICGAVDFDQSREQCRTVIKAGIDEELDQMKRTYDGLEHLLAQAAQHVSGHIPSDLDTELNVIFFPQIGFLICVRLDPVSGVGVFEGTQQSPWERMFGTENNVYYKNEDMRQLDNTFGDVYGEICDKEIEIVQGLCHEVLQHKTLLNDVSDICSELDAILALARGATMYNLRRPSMINENVIDIKGGRHVLQELTIQTFVANDTILEEARVMSMVERDQHVSLQ